MIKYNSGILLFALLAILVGLQSCATMTGVGSATFQGDIDELRDASVEALEQMGMSVSDVRGSASDGYRFSGERSEGTVQVEEGADAPAEVVTLEIEVDEVEQGEVRIRADTPASTNYSGVSAEDLRNQFFSYLEELGYESVEND